MIRVAIVTGAGSGVGQAIAIRLAAEGWHVVLVGRRQAALEATAARIQPGAALVHPCDVADADAVREMTATAEAWGPVECLVNAAGTNAPQRALAELRLETYREIVDVNLNGSFLCAWSVLAQMRSRGRGTIVNIVSEAGLKASPKAGPAYVVSKFGQRGLTEAINAEERNNGIRACSVFPGDINTPILDRRSVPPSAEARARMLQADDVATCALLAINLPHHVIVEEIVVRPR